MQELGLNPLTSRLDSTAGVGSSNVPAYFADLTMDFGQFRLMAYVGFTAGLEHLGIGLLGQSGFFDQVKVAFDLPNNVFVVQTLE